MRKLFLLLKQYWNLILFIILMAFSLRLIAKRNSIQGVDIINSSNTVVGMVYSIEGQVSQYFSLKRTNEILLQENASLHNQLSADGFVDTFQNLDATISIIGLDSARIKELNRLQNTEDTTEEVNDLITFRKSDIRKVIKYASHHYIPARVVNNSIADDRMNFVTINRGAKDGIKPNMAVVTANGIVGRVVKVSDNYATVLSLLSEGRPYNAKLVDGTTGSIIWDKGSANSVTMHKIPKIADVQIGDSIFTTGYSIFPENILIGTIAKIEMDKKSNARNLRILLSTNFRNLQIVYVVKDELAEEKDLLENETQKSVK